MFDDLPRRIEKKIEPENRRRRRKFHPEMLNEFMHFGIGEDPRLGFLMVVGIYRDELPWLYEIGIETYHGLKTTTNTEERKRLIENFERAIEMLGHPMIREAYGDSKEFYFMYKELRHYLHELLFRVEADEVQKNKKIK